uniref:Putative conserved secreted protein n=1 Tax=Rhipicephalus microplus TaxID=6941 RepID=A0A6M2D537_RHIMP
MYVTLLYIFLTLLLCNGLTVDDTPLAAYCRRALRPPVMIRGEYVVTCVYLCEGLPFRFSREHDGTRCAAFVDGYTTQGYCKDGECEVQEAARTKQ